MKTIIISGKRRLSGTSLQDRALRAASGFHDIGVREGDTVATLLRNDTVCLEVTVAAGALGAYPVPINWHAKPEEAGYILNDAHAKVLVVHADLWPRIASGVPEGVRVIIVTTPDEVREAFGIGPPESSTHDGGEPPFNTDGHPNWEPWLESHQPWAFPIPPLRPTMFYTSGSTGHPKGVRRPPIGEAQAALVSHMRKEVFGQRPGMRTVMAAPLYHSAPNSYAQMALQSGGLMVIQPRFDAEDLLALIEEHRITHMFMVPIMFFRLLSLPEATRRRYDLTSLEWVLHAAAPCPPDVKRQMIDWWGPVIHEGYAATELGWATVCSSQEWLERPGTVGRPTRDATVRILDEDGNELPSGEVGDIFVHHKALPDFTFHNHDKKRLEVERHGLFTAGDMGSLDSAGYLFLSDRRVDMVISGGVNIYPAEIEAVLIAMPGVADCAVFGVPDSEFGEKLAAAVQLEPGMALSEDAVKQFVRQRLSAFKAPAVVEFHEALPREDSGKLFKRKLRDPHWMDAGRNI